MATKATKKNFYLTSITLKAHLCPSYLEQFGHREANQTIRNDHRLWSIYKLFCKQRFFTSPPKKNPATIDTVKKTEDFCPTAGLVLDHFSQLSQEETDKILAPVKPITFFFDLFSFWLVKVCYGGSPLGGCHQPVPIIRDSSSRTEGDCGASAPEKPFVGPYSSQQVLPDIELTVRR